MVRKGSIAALVGSALLAACSLITSLDGLGDAGPVDAATEGQAMEASCLDAGLTIDGATYHPFTQGLVDDAGLAWEFFDTTSLSISAAAFEGGAFDGRYVYFAPTGSRLIVRYDTHGPTFAKPSFTSFDVTNIGSVPTGFAGATFDGQYVYFVPFHNEADGGITGNVVRYDTTQPFTASTSWDAFDTDVLLEGGVPVRSFNGAVFDGRYVNFVPYTNGVLHDGRFARFDTTASDAGSDAGNDGGTPLSNLAAWTTVDLSQQNATALGFMGGIFDGRFLYLVPYVNGTQPHGGFSATVSRFDTTKPLSTGWGAFEIDAFDSNAYGFVGGAFDGRYLYLVPHATTTIARYDTSTGLFQQSTSWTFFDVSTLLASWGDGGLPNFSGAAFDGRFIYLVPNQPGLGIIPRYDTVGSFTSPCAWSTVDLTQYNALATNFWGAIYDGQYLYFAPRGSIIARFNTKSENSMPALPGFHGSFY